MIWQQGMLTMALLTLATALPAQQAMQPLSSEEMADARVDEAEAAKDRDEISKDEIEELQQYLRDQRLQEQGVKPPRRRSRQEDSGLTPLQRNFRDALLRTTGENRPPG